MTSFSAVEDFFRAHRRASLKEIVSAISGRQSDLLGYDEILEKLHLRGQSDKGLQEIPLKAIVGSVGRYSDFTRDFLPKKAGDKDRWVNVKIAMMGLKGVPPIEAYRIGEAYFVLDGNHRVSVAMDMGLEFIQAYVVEINTLVPLGIDDDPIDLIIKSEYADFLEQTHFHEIFPDVEIRVSMPGQYEKLNEHIQVHRYFMGLELKRFIHYKEAVEDWYKHVYLPVEEAINYQGILRDFPGRETADLYLWMMRFRSELEKELGWRVKDKFLVSFFEKKFGAKPVLDLKGLLFCLKSILPGGDQGDRKGIAGLSNYRSRVEKRKLFENILVTVYDSPASWRTLEQALMIAEHENGEIYGLHVCPNDVVEPNATVRIKERFTQICNSYHVPGTLAIEQGKISEKILERSNWVDLVILNMAHPPQSQILAKLNSGLHTVISRLNRPLLAVPRDVIVGFENCLVAYDGSPKSKEALYVAAYLAANWGTHVTLLNVEENNLKTRWILREAKKYLEAHHLEAEYLIRKGQPSECILSEADGLRSDLILMGSYGYTQVLEAVLGSTVNQVLLEAKCPVLICR